MKWMNAMLLTAALSTTAFAQSGVGTTGSTPGTGSTSGASMDARGTGTTGGTGTSTMGTGTTGTGSSMNSGTTGTTGTGSSMNSGTRGSGTSTNTKVGTDCSTMTGAAYTNCTNTNKTRK